jgi:glycosyltransferase involved in cell wall biosynthesis
MIRFSVIIPIYNCSERLRVGVESIIKQSFKNWELILINDGSTDDSLKKCKEYAMTDSRIRVINQPNSGAGPARNHGIEISNGEYLIFCDADDFYNTDALEKFDKCINDSSVDLVISNYQEFKYDKDGKILITRKNIIASNSINGYMEVRKQYIDLRKKAVITAPWAKAYRRDTVIKNNIRFADLRRCQDVVFNLYYYEYVENLKIISDILYNYQTPDGDIYIHKFPVDMFEINKKVYSFTVDSLQRWKVYNQQSENYLNTCFLKDISVLLRLNYKNNWKLDKIKQKLLSMNILNDSYTIRTTKTPCVGWENILIKFIIKSKKVWLANIFSASTLFLQKISIKYVLLCKYLKLFIM